MLKTAVKGNIPLIAVHTRDSLNCASVIAALAGKVPQKFDKNSIGLNTLYYTVAAPHKSGVPDLNYDEFYERLVKLESSLIIVNPPKVTPAMFSVGYLNVPKNLLLGMMYSVTGDEEAAKGLVKALGSATLKEAAELAKLTMARDNSLTPNGIIKTRKTMFQAQPGLTLIDTQQIYYEPDALLAEWVQREKLFFLGDNVDPRIKPRGLLFDGPPGTGKTAGAKYIAAQWGVPLYRLDIAGTKNKYIGESEGNLAANLAKVDFEEPCVLLIDEVEKLFSTESSDTTSTSSGMLSQMLWWLAEHRSTVLTVMTTNNKKALPPELHREGRIDRSMMFLGLMQTEAVAFVHSVAGTFPQLKGHKLDHAKVIKAAFNMVQGPVSQARLTELVTDYVKNYIVKSGGTK